MRCRWGSWSGVPSREPDILSASLSENQYEKKFIPKANTKATISPVWPPTSPPMARNIPDSSTIRSSVFKLFIYPSPRSAELMCSNFLAYRNPHNPSTAVPSNQRGHVPQAARHKHYLWIPLPHVRQLYPRIALVSPFKHVGAAAQRDEVVHIGAGPHAHPRLAADLAANPCLLSPVLLG